MNECDIEKIQDDELRELLLDEEMKNKIKHIYESIFHFTEFVNLNDRNTKNSKQKKYIQIRKMSKSKMQGPEYDGLCGMRTMNNGYDDVDRRDTGYTTTQRKRRVVRNDDWDEDWDGDNQYDGIASTEGACASRKSPARRRATSKAVETKRSRSRTTKKSTTRKPVARRTTARKSPTRRSPTRRSPSRVSGGYDGLDALTNDGACASRKKSGAKKSTGAGRRSTSRASLSQDRSKRAKAAWRPGGYLYEANKHKSRKGSRGGSRGGRKSAKRQYDGLDSAASLTDGACASQTRRSSLQRSRSSSQKSRSSPKRSTSPQRSSRMMKNEDEWAFDGFEAPDADIAMDGACARRRKPGRPRKTTAGKASRR